MSSKAAVARAVQSDFGSIHLLERPFRELEAQVMAADGDLRGGLLLGSGRGPVAVVERVLPCGNLAPENERSLRYQLDERVIPNVLRSLDGLDLKILGSYVLASSAADVTTAVESEMPGYGYGGVVLTATAVQGSMRVAGWRPASDGNVSEIDVEVIERQAKLLVACPD